MKYFAKLDTDNTVLDIIVLADEDATTEANGITKLQADHGWSNWKQYFHDGTRKLPAAVGGTYDSELDVFKDEKPYSSWVYDSTTGLWKAPVDEPTFDPETQRIYWDEDNTNWVVESN
jgi:hypothetical protein